MIAALYTQELESVAWRGARGFTRWHLAERSAPSRTLCMRTIPDGVAVSRREQVIHDCHGCDAVYRHETRKRLEGGRKWLTT